MLKIDLNGYCIFRFPTYFNGHDFFTLPDFSKNSEKTINSWPMGFALYIDKGIKELVCERRGNMGNNENIFSPVTNGKIETYGNS